jgi:hypothetical protein
MSLSRKVGTATFGLLAVLISSSIVLADRKDQDDRRDRASQSSNNNNRPAITNSTPRNTSAGQSGSVQVQSFDRGSRSYSDGARGSSSNTRSFDGRSAAGRASDGSNTATRFYGGRSATQSTQGMIQNQDGQMSPWVLRGANPGAASAGKSGDYKSTRSGDTSNGPTQVTRFYNNPDYSSQTNRSAGNTTRTGSTSRDVPWRQSLPQDSSTQLTRDQVEKFLQLRRDNSSKTSANAGDAKFDGKLTGGIRNTGTPRSVYDYHGPGNTQTRKLNSKNDADGAWLKQFGGAGNTTADRTRLGDSALRRNGINNQQLHIPNRVNSEQLAKIKLDPIVADRTYRDWRKTAAVGSGKTADNRDWSGRWRDGQRFGAASNIRRHWSNHGSNDLPFGSDWWRRHHAHNGRWGNWDRFANYRNRPNYWWDQTSSPRLSAWITFNSATPYYWDYGPGEYINCNDGVMYVNGNWFEPAPAYYQRNLVLAQRLPVWTPEQVAQVEWLPLGVFAVARDGVPDANVLMQLAVTRDGVIGGTIFNQLTGAAFDISGTVDRDSQRAIWTYFDETGARILMESSIFNLTQPAATGLIHYSPENMQVIELVRLEQPQPEF